MKNRPQWRLTFFFLLALSQGMWGQDASSSGHYGLPVDWSHRHFLSHAQLTDADFERTAMTEPRVLYNWIQRHPGMARQMTQTPRPASPRKPPRGSTKVDWHFPLGAGTVALNMSPAKYNLDVNAAPDCTNDAVVYGLNTAGSSSQPNLVGLNNLYVNAAGTGTCPGTDPTLAFAYNVTTVGNGSVLTSPSISMDGTKIAFIETVTSGSGTVNGQTCNAPCSILHVLTVGSGSGNGSFSSNNYSAAVPGVGNNASMTSLVYSNSATTRSSVFVDYLNDAAYFGDDNGNIYKTTCVFYCVPALAPGYSQGSGIVVVSGGANKVLTSPVYDPNANKLLVGASDGNVYILSLGNCSGNPVTCTGTVSLTVGLPAGSGSCFAGYNGVVDPPVVDSTFQVWYATSGCNASGKAVMVEGNYAGVVQGSGVTMGGSTYNLHAGMPDDNYFTTALNATSVAGNLYFLGPNASKQLVLYGLTMQPKNGAGTAFSPANPPVVSTSTLVTVPGKGVSEPSAVTILQNGNADWLFFGQVAVPKNNCANPGAAEGCIFSYNVFNSGGVSTIPTANTALASEAGGTSGVVVDNVSTSSAAANVYFANQATTTTSAAPVCTTGVATPSFCAVKLTQGLLQ